MFVSLSRSEPFSLSEPLLVWKKSCSTCRHYKAQLDAWGLHYLSREMNRDPLTEADVSALIGEGPVRPWLNPRNVEYRRLGLKTRELERAEAALLIAGHNNLLRRPVLIYGAVGGLEFSVIGNQLAQVAQLFDRALPT